MPDSDIKFTSKEHAQYMYREGNALKSWIPHYRYQQTPTQDEIHRFPTLTNSLFISEFYQSKCYKRYKISFFFFWHNHNGIITMIK